MRNLWNQLKSKKKIILEVIILMIIGLFSFSLAPKTLQNDTYYTVSIGNLILENGIDGKDHFSWHENLPYTYPHWLYDVIMSLIYNLGEWDAIYISVCVMSIILGITIYEVNKKLNKNQAISFLVTLGSMYLLKDYIAARAQLVTFIIYVIVIYFMEKFLENPKKFYYGIGIILASILIANLHVAVWPFIFVLSLPYIAEYFLSIISDIVIYQKVEIWYKKILLQFYKKDNPAVEKIKKSLEQIYFSNEKRKEAREAEEPYKIKMQRNKNVKWLILVMIICAFTGLLTPLENSTPYTYLYYTMKGNTVNNINEHLPLTLIDNIPIMCAIIIVLSLLIFTKAKIRLSDLLMLGGLTYLMFSSRRQSTMFILIGSLILNRMITEAIKIYGTVKLERLYRQIISVLSIVAGCGIIVLSINYIDKKKDDVYVSTSTYPVEAADWILENLDIHNIRLFNEYNYGSYLLYKGIPVFIDSRADLYSPEFNGEEDIFMDFINTSNIGRYYGTTFEKYDITHVLLYKNSKISMLIDKTEPENYNKIYSDDHFVIYEVIK